jgi:hypothetical protein
MGRSLSTNLGTTKADALWGAKREVAANGAGLRHWAGRVLSETPD